MRFSTSIPSCLQNSIRCSSYRSGSIRRVPGGPTCHSRPGPSPHVGPGCWSNLARRMAFHTLHFAKPSRVAGPRLAATQSTHGSGIRTLSFMARTSTQNFLRFHDERYAGFSALIRSTFDDAVSNFTDGSIDLLHIDGYHTYDAVRHDFETWYPKLSDRGVVLFHDTNVRERDFGVSRVFEEASKRFPSFEFLHGSGLGVLSVGGAVPAPIARLCSLTRSSDISRFRERFAYLGARWSAEWLTRVSQEREQEARRSAADVERRMADTLTQVRAAEMDAETRIAEAQARDRRKRSVLSLKATRRWCPLPSNCRSNNAGTNPRSPRCDVKSRRVNSTMRARIGTAANCRQLVPVVSQAGRTMRPESDLLGAHSVGNASTDPCHSGAGPSATGGGGP